MTSTKPLKFVMLGESKVGKTSIFAQYNEGKFDPDYKPTLSAQFLRMEIKISDSNATTVDIWEAPGGKTYRSIAKIYYKETNAFLLVYDETDEDSFNELKNFWYEQVKDLGQILVVIANKCDLSDKKVKKKKKKKYAESIGAMFFEISAKENIGISNMFEKIAEAAKNKYNGN